MTSLRDDLLVSKARDRNRTGDLVLTKDALYRLSYASVLPRAGDGARTRDPQLGRLMLYQLSYARVRPRAARYKVVGEGFEPS